MLIEKISQLKAYKGLLRSLSNGAAPASLGLMRSARLPVAAALSLELARPVLYVTGRTDQALAAVDELNFWMPNSAPRIFPDPTPMFYEQAAWGSATRRDRLQVLTMLAGYHRVPSQKPVANPLIIAPIRALMTRTLPLREFLRNSRVLRLRQMISVNELISDLLRAGYQVVDIVLEPGQVSKRGGIMDIWPPPDTDPSRIELFGNDVETIRKFDPVTQRTKSLVDEIRIPPAKEVISSTREPAVKELSEFEIPLQYSEITGLLDYLPKKSVVLFDDLDLTENIALEVEEQAVRMRQESIGYEVLDPEFPLPYLSWSELQDNLDSQTVLELGYSKADQASELAERFSPSPRFGGHIKSFLQQASGWVENGDRVYLASRQVQRLIELWKESYPLSIDKVDIIEGALSEGWTLTQDKGPVLHLISDHEIFGWERPQPRKRVRALAESPESSYADLKPGSWVVHVDFGIGKFVGLVQRSLDGIFRDFLCVEYAEGDQLFVPVHQADRLNRYVGASGEVPRMTRLGTGEWAQTRSRVKQAVLEIAQDLLELYARRKTAEGFRFDKDSSWQQDLEASFPFYETPDQSKAIIEVKADMESGKPMDRLLCGDVGYGKTEVALRAAFKAVMSGKQVAVLVPTTVLAQQHYDTFRNRLVPFPVTVEMLSRFRTEKQQAEVIKELNAGGIDILIGTHRLLQKDVKFKNLGLLIIDEEQRFGVAHKENLKKMRSEVDVLTLTATPIPRTLYMALSGVRDISVINTPPAERLPVVTHIGPYSQRLIRQSILREMERGGQVFFVHNRVHTIHAMKRHLENLVPEARIGIGHGQMVEADLSRVMHQFTNGDIDVLLSTSIIESGLDIPNANTLIVDRADTFGLAQLYQLRGRVGRGGQRAYAYFFRHRRKPPTIEGQERLEVIAENTQLGAGYSIAMRDLEMRGAGELLGSRQHGYIAAVGFHLYTKLLAQAVRQINQLKDHGAPVTKGLETNLNLAVNVELPIRTGIPAELVPDQAIRLGLYRRMAGLQSVEELDSLQAEYADRFGELPADFTNLFYMFKVKVLAEEAGLASVSTEGDQLILRFPPLPDNLSQNLASIGLGTRIGKNAYWWSFPKDENAWKTELLAILDAIRNSSIP